MTDRDPVDYAWNMRKGEALQSAFADMNSAKDTLLELSVLDPNKYEARRLRSLVKYVDDLMAEIEEML